MQRQLNWKGSYFCLCNKLIELFEAFWQCLNGNRIYIVRRFRGWKLQHLQEFRRNTPKNIEVYGSCDLRRFSLHKNALWVNGGMIFI